MTRTPHQLGEDMAELVRTVRRKLRRSWVLTGLAVFEIAVLGCLLATSTIDMLVPLSVPLRIAAWAVFWAVFALTLVLGVLWQAIRPLRMSHVASRIERAIPGMHNRLITVLDLRQRNGDAHAEPEFVSALLKQTRSKLETFQVDSVASPRPARAGFAVGIGVAVLGVAMALLLGERLPTAMARVLRPTAPIPPVSWVRIQGPGDLRGLQGEPLEIAAQVDRGQVESLTLELRQANATGLWSHYPMQPASDAPGRFAFRLAALDGDYEYRIVGGGTWTPPARVTMLARPVLQDLTFSVAMPAYLRVAEPRPVEPSATQVSAPVGSAIIVSADVTCIGQDIVSGDIVLLDTQTATREVEAADETVWFDDMLPGDAQVHGTWRWASPPGAGAFSGVKAHTFDWARSPYGFQTRLHKLVMAPDAAMFLYVWIDPADPPGRLAVTLEAPKRKARLVWGDSDIKAEKGVEVVAMGPLPEPGGWRRLEAPLEKIMGAKPSEAVALSGITFQIDGGRVYFDRAGAVVRRKEQRQITEVKEVGRIAMARDESGRWVGRIPVEADAQFTVRFTSESGHVNQARKPIPIVATQDQPPTLMVEKPGRSLTVVTEEPVPVVVRAFDDLGVDAVGIDYGPEADKLEPTVWIEHVSGVHTSRLVFTALDLERRQLKPGASLYYRLVVRDRKGQLAHSQTYRLGLAAPEQASGPDVVRRDPSATGLLEKIGSLLSVQSELSQAAVDLLAALPEAVLTVDASNATLVQLTNPDGSPLTPEQWKQLLGDPYENLDEDARRQLADLSQKIAQERSAMRSLAEQFAAAAKAALESPLTLPVEVESLNQMAQRAAMLAEYDPFVEGDQAIRDRLAALTELTPEQREQLQAMQAQLQQLTQARAAMNEQDPVAFNRQMAQMAAQLRAQRAVQQMQSLAMHLENQQEQFAAVQRQLEQLRQQASAAEPAALEQVSVQQQELDERAVELLKQAQELLDKRAAEQDRLPPAPWTPPGREVERMPVERDTPEEKPEAQTPEQRQAAQDATVDALKERIKAMEDENWWDQPVQTPPENRTLVESERFADRDTRPVERAAPTDAMLTPRQMLQQHQDQMHQQLTENASELATTRNQLSQVMGQISGMLDQLDAPPQGQTLGQPASPLASVQALSQAMSSPEAQRMMQMSQRAATQAMLQAMRVQLDGGGPTQGASEAELRPGVVWNVDLGELPDGVAPGAYLYRLPPRIREPLIEGMSEQGPDGYQPLIDEYYRLLRQPEVKE